MLSYLHSFHAGNFADLQKHAALTLCLEMMQEKSSGIAVFDTHAGSGLYDLTSERARKTAEADAGIQRVWAARSELEPDWRPMLEVLESLNPGADQLRQYPGSPEWLRRHLRSQDSQTVFELHPSESDQLREWAGPGIVRVLREDGLKGLLKQLPPPQPRLLVLVDPSWEVKTDYQEVPATLAKAWKKCRHGVFIVWYPILTSHAHEPMLSVLAQSGVRKVLASELMLDSPPGRGMVGSGLLLVNPPWGFAERFQVLMDQVALTLEATLSQRWLVPE